MHVRHRSALSLRGGIAVAAVVALLPLLWVDTASSAPILPVPTSRVVTVIKDSRVHELSSMASRAHDRRHKYVANDSGSKPVVYGFDLRTGRTTGTVHLVGPHPRDLEAMAPGRHRTLWLGDIGDNFHKRGTVRLYRVPVPRRRAQWVRPDSMRLRYPDGRHNAEAMVVSRRSGAKWIITKDRVGHVYRVPPHAGRHGTSTMRRIRGVSTQAYVTDGVVLAGGNAVVLRNYGVAGLYRLPSWRPIGMFRLPWQRQGEAIAQEHGTRALLLGSEGVRSKVLRTWIPRSLWRRVERH